jgi:AraC-like DNA-binding protein
MPIAASCGLEETAIAVPVALRGVVSSIARVTATGPRYISPPRGSVQILVRADGAYVVGPHLRVLRKAADAGSALAVRIVTGAAPALFGVTAVELADRAVRLADLWHGSTGSLEDQLLARAGHVRPDRAMVHAAARLDAEPGLPIEQLSRELAISDRQLRRRFVAAVGLSPKRYARAARIRRVIGQAQPHARWAEIAVASGFYDQAHMIAEFHDVVGATPAAFAAELQLS